MIDPDALTARAKVYLDTLREPDMPEHHAALRPIVACAIKSDRVFLRFDSGAEAIKMNNNLQRLGGVGTFVDRHTHRRAQIPMRCCRSCRALYALPQDVKDAATSLGMPSNAGSLTDERIQDVCVGSMYNAYNSLSIQKAEVYCFKDFVVMIDLTGNIDGRFLSAPRRGLLSTANTR